MSKYTLTKTGSQAHTMTGGRVIVPDEVAENQKEYDGKTFPALAENRLTTETTNDNTESKGSNEMNANNTEANNTEAIEAANDNAKENTANATETATQAPGTEDNTEASEDATEAPGVPAQAPKAPVVLVIDKYGKTDTFFDNLKTVLGCVSTDEMRLILQRVKVEACEIDGFGVDEKGQSVKIKIPGSVFVATDGLRLAMLETERIYTPGTYEIKQAKGKTIVLQEDMHATPYPNFRQVIPPTDGLFSFECHNAPGLLFGCSRLGLILNHEYVLNLPERDYTAYVGETIAPVVFRCDGFQYVLMPLRIDGKVSRYDALEKEVTRRVIAEMVEAEEKAEAEADKAQAVA